MRVFGRILLSATVVGLATSTVRADLIGLRVFREGLYGSAAPVDGPLWIYRVYAEFTQPSDSVFMWGLGGGLLGPGFIRNITISGDPGTGFNNVPDNDSGNLAPIHPLSARDWDTYMTIGLVYGSLGPGGDDGTGFFGGTPTFIQHGSTFWTGSTAGVQINPGTTAQGRGDFISTIGNDTNTRVLLMQLVVNAGEHVDGSIGVAWRTTTTTVAQELPFSSIPTPGSMISLVSMLWLIQSRKRRR